MFLIVAFYIITWPHYICYEDTHYVRDTLFTFRSKCKQCIRVYKLHTLWLFSLFLFSLCPKENKYYSWMTDVTWIILTMSLLRFWALNVVGPLLSGRVRELSDFIQNIFICVPKMIKGLTGLERHEGEYLMTGFSFLGELSLSSYTYVFKCMKGSRGQKWTIFHLSFWCNHLSST